MRRIAILGIGKLGEAIAEGLLKSGELGVLYLVERSEERRRDAARKYRATVTVDPLAACKFTEEIILAVKPVDVLDLCRTIAPALKPEQTVISVAAGIKLSRIKEALKGHAQAARVIPNLAVAVRSSITGVYSDNAAAREETSALFQLLGKCVNCADDHGIDQLTALAASAPAFLAEFLEGLQLAGEELHIEGSREVVMQMAQGTVKLLDASRNKLSDFITSVRTPGGTTAAGLQQLDAVHLRDVLRTALEASIKRAGELDSEIQ